MILGLAEKFALDEDRLLGWMLCLVSMLLSRLWRRERHEKTAFMTLVSNGIKTALAMLLRAYNFA